MAKQETGTYWVVSVPNSASSGNMNKNMSSKNKADEAKLTHRELEMRTSKYCNIFSLNLPLNKLKVGTLDSLMSLSDELGKVDTMVESIIKKIERAYGDLKSEPLTVEAVSPEKYIETFEWNFAKYPASLSLAQITQKIQGNVAQSDDDLRKRSSKLLEIQQSLGAIERKETGTLLVAPLAEWVKEEDLINREYITTLLVVVPKQKQQDFEARYEILERLAAEKEKNKAGKEQADNADAAPTDDKKKEDTILNVVPRSAKLLTTKGEFALYRVIVFKKGADTFKTLARQERWTVRSYKHNPDEQKNNLEKKEKLAKVKRDTQNNLIRWCEATYSDVFSGWIHLKSIRVFVESVLRYGIPVNFQANLLKPKKGYRTKLRSVLDDMYSHLSSKGMISADDQGTDVFSGLGADFYPYVYVAIDLEEMM